ncbi:MAG: hypothetical protein IPH48_16910 [bacterium]|nr:hypothetical protein [bacterium]
MNDPRPDLQAHYGRQGLLEEIEALLAACGPAADGEGCPRAGRRFHPAAAPPPATGPAGGAAALAECWTWAAASGGPRVGCGGWWARRVL